MEFENVTDTAQANGDGPTPDEPKEPTWQQILDAPDYLTLLKGKKSPTAKEYETKIQSILKEGVKLRLGAGTVEGLADVAALLALGPNFAERAGLLADADENAKKAIDILTAPDNPWIMFAVATIPLVSQIVRNHETQITAARNRPKKSREERKAERAARPKAEITLPFIKRKIRIPFALKVSFGNMFRQNSVEPQHLINAVYQSDKVRAAIYDKYGVHIATRSNL